jgi:MFS family permease
VTDQTAEELPMVEGLDASLDAPGATDEEAPGALDVFRNRPFLLLWLSQLFTQIGGNMVLFGLTVIVVDSTNSTTANSVLILSFLVPAVAFSAVAGVYVDRFDKRHVLVATNVLRAGLSVALWAVGANLLLLLLFNALISTVTVFFAPAEAAMIPQVVPRKQLLSANGVFTLTLNAAFAIGFALLGPIVVTLLGVPALILVVGACYLVAAGFCWTLPPAPPVVAVPGEPQQGTAGEAEEAMGSTLGQLREGIAFIRANRRIAWSLVYLGIAASLVGVLGVLGPGFAKDSLGLETKDFVVVVLPLAFGIVMGILFLNNFGHLMPRRRIIEYGLIALGILVFLMAAAGPISGLLGRAESAAGLGTPADVSSLIGMVTSLLAIVVFFALLAGIAYAFVAIPAQTQLQEDLPEDVRGRVFGVLNMLVSTASFLPIIIVGPVADIFGTTQVLYIVAIAITVSGILSYVTRGPLKPAEAKAMATGPTTPAGLDPVAVATASEMEAGERRHSRHAAEAAASLSAAETAAGTTQAADVPLDAGSAPDAAPESIPESIPESTEAGRGDPSEDE